MASSVLSWKTLAVGALLVMCSSLWDFRQIGEQMETLRALRLCEVKYASLSVEALGRAMRDHARTTHPDVAVGGALGPCATEEINDLRASIRKHGSIGRMAWALHKIGVAPSRVETFFMLALIAGGGCLVHALRRIPTRYARTTRLLIYLGLMERGQTASTERQLMKKLKHAEFVYGVPPCSTHCGDTPSQCTVGGWMYKDVYVFWNDGGTCKHFKVTLPTDSMSSWSRSAFWGGVARFAANLGDGFQPEDLVALASGYWIKQYHDELQEDLKQIKGTMSMLGDVAQDDKEEVNEEL